MNIFAEAAAIARAGRPADAVKFIEDAAERGDPEGHVIVAHWLLYGSDRPRDVTAARRHLELAADQGKSDAIRLLAHLTASGTGCERDREQALQMLQQIADVDRLAADELALLPRMMSDGDAANAPRERLSSDPSIEIVHDLLLPEERAYLMRRAEPLLKPSLVDDPVRGRGVPDPIRTSHGAAFVPHDEDLVIQQINRRIATASGTEVSHGEALYVMRYEPGQEYRPHHDALAGLRNPRRWTAIFYLNDDYEGGETVFPDLSISIRGRAGDLLIFRNVDAEGRPHPKMLHAGQPVTRGAKWIATRWIRGAPHDPYDRG